MASEFSSCPLKVLLIFSCISCSSSNLQHTLALRQGLKLPKELRLNHFDLRPALVSRIRGGSDVSVNTLELLSKVFEDHLPKRFHLGPVLGHGAFSVVREATDSESKQEVAVKAVLIPKKVDQPGYSNLQDVYRIETEVKILNMSDHSHIIKLLHFFPSPEGCVLVLERCHGGELFSWMQNLEVHEDGTRRWAEHIISEVFVARMIRQLLSAVAYLHERRIVHRDLKLENILLKEAFHPERDIELKIIDVGFGKMVAPPHAPSRHRHIAGCSGLLMRRRRIFRVKGLLVKALS
jgi:serine/threonine protein kinase